jgi:hypothetical protein
MTKFLDTKISPSSEYDRVKEELDSWKAELNSWKAAVSNEVRVYQ